MRLRKLAGACALITLLALVVGAALVVPRAHELGAVPGVRVAGVVLTHGEPVLPQLEQRASALGATRIKLSLPGVEQPIERTLQELGLELDTVELARRASTVGQHGGWLTQYEERRAARLGLVDLPLHFALDRDQFTRVVASLKEATDRPSVDARFDLAGLGVVTETGPVEQASTSSAAPPTVVDDRPGVYLDVDASAERVRAAVMRGQREVELVQTEIAPLVNREFLERVGHDRLVAEFGTRFGRGGDADNRAINIETAAARLSGVVLAPGELVSFNALVGARTLDNGFRPGWEIYRGEMVRGIGGGTCQVSSTLHAAAVYGGLDVVERAPHSRPSAYMPLGLDSTVAWPSVDLKLRNPWPFPLVIHAVVRGTELRVQLLGSEKPATVRWHTETLAILPFKRKVTESSWLSEGTVIKKQKGIRGYRLRRVREISLADGSKRTEETIDVYPPTAEHFIVPTGGDLAELLPPPADGSVEARDAAAAEGTAAEGTAAEGAAAEGAAAGVVIATEDRFEP